MKKNLTREERLRNRTDIDNLFRNPERMSRCNGAKLLASRNNLRISRFAAIPIRKIGAAVKRNYVRRVLKEIYRNFKREVRDGFDIIIIAYSGVYNYIDLKEQFIYLIHKADIAR